MALSMPVRPASGPRTWTVIDEGYQTVVPVVPVEAWLEAHRHLWSPNRLHRPLPGGDRMAIQRAGPRPGALRPEHQPVGAHRKPHQEGQRAVWIRIPRDQQLHNHAVCQPV